MVTRVWEDAGKEIQIKNAESPESLSAKATPQYFETYVRTSDFLKVILNMKGPTVSPSMVRESI